MTAVEFYAMAATARASSRPVAQVVLLAACSVAFVLEIWATFGTPRFNGAIGWVASDYVSGMATVTYVKPGWPADRAGLRVGDKVVQHYGSISENVARSRWIVGEPVPLQVVRNGKHLIISIIPAPAPTTATFWLTAALDLWFIAFATIIALRGTDLQARMLSWIVLFFALSDLLNNDAHGFVSPWPWINEFVWLFGWPLTQASFALVAFLASTFARPVSIMRRVFEVLAYGATVAVTFTSVIFLLSLIAPWFDAATSLNDQVNNISSVAAAFLAATCAAIAIGAASGSERQRAIWVLAPLGAVLVVSGFTSILSNFAGGYWNGWLEPLNRASTILTCIVAFVLTYAVVKRRLLDVTFVINRAAVFSVVSLIVIGAFVLTEWLFNQVFAQASRTTSTLVSVTVALVLGISLTYVHRYVDRFVDRVFFWKRHEHEQSLRAFAHEAAFITDYDALLDDTLNEVSMHAETDRVSILIRDEDGGYTTVRRSSGDLERVSENDRAILKMRARRKEIDLDDVETALGGAWAYPLMSRGDLLGILVCGTKRDGESYAPDENEALAVLAQSVGTALGSLRAQDDDLRKVVYEMRDALRALLQVQSHITQPFER